MDLFLILYILILMTLFFFLGAAIGGAARSFKTYFFGFKENEYYCCQADSAREQTLVEGSALAKAALATTAVVAAGDQVQEKDDIVKIKQDEVVVDETKEWNGSEAHQEGQDVDITAPVHRDEEATIERQTTNDDVAQPIATDEINHEDGFQDAAVIRDDEATSVEPPPQDEERQAPIEWDYTRDAINYDDVVFSADGPSDDLTLISGIDVPFQNQLNELGLHKFEQIANLSEREVGYLRSKFGFTSQLNEQVWIEQPQILAAGGVTAFSQQQSAQEPSDNQEPSDDQIDQAEDHRLEKAALAAAAAAVVKEVVFDKPKEQTVASEEQTQPEEVTEQPAEVSVKDDNAYEQRFAYESDESQASGEAEQEVLDQKDEPQRHISRDEGDDGRLLGQEARKERDEEWRERYQHERKILPPGQRGEQPQAVADETVVVSPAVDSDDLRQIKYISTGIEKKLNLLGVYKLSQIAQWSQEEVDHISEELEFKGRIEDENWISQAAQILAASQKTTNADNLPTSTLNQGDHELDQLTDLTEDEKELLLSNGIARLSQISSWSISHVNWVANLLQIKDPSRITNWIEIAKKGQAGHVVSGQEREQSLEKVTVSQTHQGDHELDLLTDITQDEKELLLINGIARLSQIASWSLSDKERAATLLQIQDPARLATWIEIAKKEQTASQDQAQSLETVTSGLTTQEVTNELDQISDISGQERQLLKEKGIANLSQIANWSGADITWASLLLGLQEKTRLLAWVEQAKQLVAGQEGEAPVQASYSGHEDDLKRIRGIDAETETKLKEIGIMSYAQIAEFQQADMDKVNDVLGTSGRVERQYWVVQAKVLVDGGQTDFSKLYDGSN